MKIDEIKKEIQSLNAVATELTEQFTQTYGDEIPQEPAQLSEGLRFKTDTDHFTEAERAVNERLADTIVSSMRTERTLSNELSKIMKAQQNREQYADTLDKGTDLVTLYKQTDETLQQAESITKTLNRLSRALQNIACNRYFNSLTHRGKSRPKDRYNAILSEIDAIGNGADRVTADGEAVRTGGFVIFNERGRSSAEDNAYIEKLYQFFDAIQAVNLICYYSTAYYEFHYSTILPTSYKDITADKQRAFIRETIEPCFKSHLDAVKALKMPTGEAESIITRAVEGVYNQLNLTLKGDEADKLLQVKRNPVTDYLLPTTKVHRELFSGTHTESIEGKQITIYDYLDEKTAEKKDVHTYLSVSYNELEGVTGIKPFTPEQETTYNAIDSEFQAGNSIVTTRQIYKTMLGGDSNAKLSDSKREELTELIEDLAKTRATIDNSEHAKHTGRKKFVRVTDNLLNVVHLEEAEIDGKVLRDVWLIKERPILSRYADSIGQIRNIPMKLLQTGTGVTYTALREHLLTQILYMRNDRQKRANRTILLAPVYTDLYKDADTHQKQRLTENAEKMLQHWIREPYKDNKPLIHSYELEYSEGTQREIAKAESLGKSTQKIKRVAVTVKIYFEGNKLSAEASKNRIIALDAKRGGTQKKRGRKK